MAFVKKFFKNIKNAFVEAAQDIKQGNSTPNAQPVNESSTESMTPTPEINADVKQTITEHAAKRASEKEINSPPTKTDPANIKTPNHELDYAQTAAAVAATVPKMYKTAPHAKIIEESTPDIMTHDFTPPSNASLEDVLYELDIDPHAITISSGIVTIPFDAFGCDFETKKQLITSLRKEFAATDIHPVVTSSIPEEIARRIFKNIKSREAECFILGSLFISVDQDIDDEGFIVAEITNVDTGLSALLDIPATMNMSEINVDFNLIVANAHAAYEQVQ